MKVYLIMFLLAVFSAIISTYISFSQESESLLIEKRYVDVKVLFSRSFLWLSVIPFLFVAGARYRVGTDYSVYLELQIPQLLRGVDYRLEYEYLYQLLIKFGIFLGNTQWIFILTHVVFLFFMWKSIQDLSVNKALSIFVFMFGAFYNLSLNTMRQFIAMAIFMYAIKYIINKRLVFYVFWIAIAFMFHKSAILFLPLYFLPRIKFNEYAVMVLLPLVAVFSELFRKIFMKLTSFLGIYANYFGSQFDYGSIQWVFVLFNFLVLIFMVIGKKQFNLNTNENYFGASSLTKKNCQDFETTFFNLQVLATVVSILSSILPNSTRIIFMFSIGQIVYVPYIMTKIQKEKYGIFLNGLVLIGYVLLFLNLIVFKNLGETLPYTFI